MPVQIATTDGRNSYLHLLDEAWQQHLTQRADNAPTVISTFAGGGGSSLGYSMAGYRELLAVEWDDHASATFKTNFPEVPLYHGDIAKLSVEEILQRTGIEPYQLDVFDGSPPCQGFSTAGKRDMDDTRNGLFREYIRLLKGLKPKVFVMENVSGMIKGKMKLIFADILMSLKEAGYKVSARLMNAMYFSVPQSRQRMIFIGVRSDLGIEPSHPVAQAIPFTLRDAISQVCNAQTDLAESKYPETAYCHKLLLQMKPGEKGEKYHHKQGSYFGLHRLQMDRPSRTVLKGDGGGGACQCCHPYENRRLTIPEVKRVGSFPDEFQIHGKVGERWVRIGNSVPPLFMRKVAAHIREKILGH